MKILIKIITLSLLLSVSSIANANWFGNNRYNNNCNDWPVWTPMYWMQEMSGSNNCYGNRYGYGNYPSPHQVLNSPFPYSGYQNPYQSNQYFNNFRNPYSNPYGNLNRYGGGFSGMPFNRFSSNGFNNPFSSFGRTSPWSSYSSPFSGGFPAMSPLGGMGGFGSPFSPNPMTMGGMGMPGMSPLNRFGGGMPFGGTGFPFR